MLGSLARRGIRKAVAFLSLWMLVAACGAEALGQRARERDTVVG